MAEQQKQQPQQPKPQQQPSSTASEPGALLPFGSEYRKEAERYLEANHWEAVSADPYGNKNWRDPAGSKGPPEDLEVRLPITRRDDPRYGDGNNFEVIKQKCGPPLSDWVYTTAEAVDIQHTRDEHDDNAKGTPLERLHRVEEELVQHRLLLKDLFYKLEHVEEINAAIPAEREKAIGQIARGKIKLAALIQEGKKKLKVG